MTESDDHGKTLQSPCGSQGSQIFFSKHFTQIPICLPYAASGKLPGAVPQVRTKGNGHHGSGSVHLLCSVPTGGAASDGDLVAGHLTVLSGSCGLHPGVGIDPGPSSLGVMSLRCT